MPDLVTPLITVIGSVAAAVGGSAVASSAQNRRETRLRQSIVENAELIDRIKTGPTAWADAIPAIESLTNRQLEELIRREEESLGKQVNWHYLGPVVFVISATAWFPIWMWTLAGVWARIAAAVSTTTMVLFVIVAFYAIFPSGTKKEKKDSQSN